MKTTRVIVSVLFLLVGSMAWALDPTYVLDPLHSTLGFVAVKNGDVEVPGTFKKFTGEFRSDTVAGQEKLISGYVEVDLDSIQTPDNPVRDQNIRNFFFETAKKSLFKTARFMLDPKKPLLVGEAKEQELILTGKLALHGHLISLEVPVTVTREGKTIHVKSRGAVSLPFEKWNLVRSAKALVKVCGHKELQQSVALNFDLQFIVR